MSVPVATTTRNTTEQRAAADPSASAWVVASAGTGKTHVLTDRVLRLLLDGTAPERILCLTFTKAAAAEMANRIQQRLGRWTSWNDDELRQALRDLIGREPGDDTMVRARRLFARVLDAQGGLKIQTIHAFCQSLLGRFPLEARIAPHFQAMDERSAAERIANAREAVLAAASGGHDDDLASALSHITALVDESQFTDLMRALVAERTRLDRLLGGPGGLDGALAAARRRLGLGDEETSAAIMDGAVAEQAFDRAGLERAARAMAESTRKTDLERAEGLRAWLDADENGRRRLFGEGYCSLFLKADGAPRAESKLMTKAVREAEADGFSALLAEQARVVAVIERQRALATVRATAVLLRLGQALVDAYARVKRRNAVLDYDDLIFKVRDLLARPGVAPWVLYKLDGGLDHILVDEAQDTNPEQWDVVASLADEFFAGAGARETHRTVFAVGDPKQSIYSFQRADPARFAAMEDHFAARVKEAGEIWREVPLQRSFRSTPAVLMLVDEVFSDPAVRDGVDDRYEIRHIANRRGEAGMVEVWPVEQPERKEPAKPWEPPVRARKARGASGRLANRIAGRVRCWLDGGEVLEATGRPVRAGDIMILVQRRSEFVEQMVRALKTRNVPVAGVDRMVLTEQLAIMDLVALGRFLMLPSDDLTLAVVLKGPLVGLGEEALFALAHFRGAKEPLWRALRRRRGEREDFAAAHDYLADLLARVDFSAPYEFYAGLLGAGGGRRRIVLRLGVEANDPIDEFLGLALAYERSHPPALQAFLHWVEAGGVEVKRDLEQARDEVRVMTVHGAKGLQAPIVFLPDTCRTPSRVSPLLWLDDGSGSEILLWPGRKDNEDPICRAAREEQRRARDGEYRRLLYVALTRAADRLYVCGWDTTHRRPAGCWYDLIDAAMRRRGRPLVAEEEGGVWRLESPQEEPVAAAKASPPVPMSAELPDWALRDAPAEPRPPRPLAPSRPVGDEPPVQSPLAGGGRRFRRGNLVHRLLQLLPDLPEARRADAARRFLASRAADLDEAEREVLARETLAVLSEPAFASLFGPDSRAEVPITGVIAGTVVAGQLDRLMVTEKAVLVVDYKTNRPPPLRPEDVPGVYLRQMAAYRALLRGVYPHRDVRCALLWTDGPSLMPLDEALLELPPP